MKLKFTINYNTAWGESMHVVICYHSQDGSSRQQNLLMQTEDGQLWVLETAALVSRHHPLSHIEYHYHEIISDLLLLSVLLLDFL